MKTPLINSTSIRRHVSHACILALLATLVGCAHGPTCYSSAQFNIIPASDVPADVTPPMVIRKVAPEYPYYMKRLGIPGSAEVVCRIDENGTVQNVGYRSATNSEFASCAVAAAQKWSFAPGTHNGRRVAMFALIPFQFGFELDERRFAPDGRISLLGIAEDGLTR